MHDLEPYFGWRDHYIASEDERSPFYNREYSEFEFSNTIYNFYIHPQWDNFGSSTLYLKVLYTDYQEQYAIIELMGEWNDCLHNDIMYLKREVIEPMIESNIKKFILIGENVLNFHVSDDCYYSEWYDDIGIDGWISVINFREHVVEEMKNLHLNYYMNIDEGFNDINWRILDPPALKNIVEETRHRTLLPS